MSINIIKKDYHDFDIEPLICLVTDSKKTASSLFFVPDCSCSKICERVGYSSIRAAKPQAAPVLCWGQDARTGARTTHCSRYSDIPLPHRFLSKRETARSLDSKVSDISKSIHCS